MPRPLITGASGFIGQQLVAALVSRGEEPVCLVRKTSPSAPLEKLGARLAYGDVTQPESLPAAVRDVSAVYHLAGLTKGRNLAEYGRVNEAGVENIMAACGTLNTPPPVLVVSSLSAAGPMIEDRLREETDLIAPVSDYGRSKRAGELAAERWAGRIPITVVRPPIVVGPGDTQGLPLFKSVKKLNRHIVLGLARKVSVIHTADLVAGMLAALERGERLPGRPGEPGQGYYFFSDDEHPTYANWGRMAGIAVGRPDVKVVRVPKQMIWLPAGWGELLGRVTRRARYTNFDRVREITAGHWICSPAKAQRQLGFQTAAPLQQRMNETAAWYREQGWL